MESTEVNKLCPHCGSYYQGDQHDCSTPVEPQKTIEPLAPKLDARVEELKRAMDTQVGGDHYLKMPIQPFEYSYANDIGPLEHTAIKYVSRWKDKGGLQDIQKAINTLQQLIELEGKYKKVKA